VHLRIGSGQNQRRNVHRRERKGGGDGSRRISVTVAPSEWKASADNIETVPNSCSEQGFANSFFASGKGAWDRVQQDVVLTFQV
jgi:hypothetical protein